MAFMGIMAVVNVYISRNNINIAIIRMVNNTHVDSLTNITTNEEETLCATNSSHEASGNAVSPVTSDGPLILDQSQQTILLACYYWGYTANQLTAGYFAFRFGFKLALGVGIGISAVLTYLFPYIIMIPTHGYMLAVITRVIIGFFHVCTFSHLLKLIFQRRRVSQQCKELGQNGPQEQCQQDFSILCLMCFS